MAQPLPPWGRGPTDQSAWGRGPTDQSAWGSGTTSRPAAAVPPAVVPPAAVPPPAVPPAGVPPAARAAGPTGVVRGPVDPAILRVVCVTWNASGVRVCGELSQAAADRARSGFFSRLYSKPCAAPDFLNTVHNIAISSAAHLIVVATQDEADSSELHTIALPDMLKNISYRLVKKYETTALGPDHARFPQEYATVPTGKPKDSYLRTSVYAIEAGPKPTMYDRAVSQEKALNKLLGRNTQTVDVCEGCVPGGVLAGKGGALASYVWVEGYGRMVFINTYVPNATVVGDYRTYRAITKNYNQLCMITLYNKLVLSLGPDATLRNVFLMGNFNSDIQLPVPAISQEQLTQQITADLSAAAIAKWLSRDELTIRRLTGEPPFSSFLEGTNNSGPTFPPTSRMTRGRGDSCIVFSSDVSKPTSLPTSCYNVDGGNEQYATIAWDDRILYNKLTASGSIECVAYERLDGGGLEGSDHTAVFGAFHLAA